MDALKVQGVGQPSRPNDPTYLSSHDAQLFAQGMSFSGHERDKLWINRGADGFADLSDISGADSPNDGRAAIAADFDDDGDLDLFVHHIQRERHGLLRNNIGAPGGAGNRFLKLRLRATKSQHEAIGATVVVRTPLGPVAQVLARGSGFASCLPPELVFGLGAAESAEVEVIWPGAKREAFGALPANSRALLVEGSGKPEPIAARTRRLPDPQPEGLKLSEGDLVPSMTLVDRNGRETVLDVRKLGGGKTLFLNFWASWCPPCVAEIPALQKIAARGEVAVAAIGLDPPGNREKARALLDQRGGRFEAFFLPESAQPGVVGVEAVVDLERLPIPTTLVISPEGRIESVLRGPVADPR
ncbi:MAG: ASPIC/UnbV domain-containing protein [Planctomycetota bacterium]